MLWRAARSCTGGWLYFYSIPVLLAELAMALLSNLFLLSLWRQVERPARWLEDILPLEEFPAVDVYIVCYTGECKTNAAAHEVPILQVSKWLEDTVL
jgi:hypothetical protein